MLDLEVVTHTHICQRRDLKKMALVHFGSMWSLRENGSVATEIATLRKVMNANVVKDDSLGQASVRIGQMLSC